GTANEHSGGAFRKSDALTRHTPDPGRMRVPFRNFTVNRKRVTACFFAVKTLKKHGEVSGCWELHSGRRLRCLRLLRRLRFRGCIDRISGPEFFACGMFVCRFENVREYATCCSALRKAVKSLTELL